MSVPTLTLTRTIVRFVRNGEVVREVVVEPWGFDIRKLSPAERVAYVAYLVQEGRYDEVEKILRLPPYLKLVLPRGGARDEASRAMLNRVLAQVLDPEYRKGMLVRYVESKREEIVGAATSRGVPRGVAEQLVDRFVEEVKSAKTLEEVIHYESKNPVDYVVALARGRVPLAH